MTAAMSCWLRSSGPSTGTSAAPAHEPSRSKRAATAAMSLVATAGPVRSGRDGPKNTPSSLIRPTWRSRLSMKDGMHSARNGTPDPAIRSSIASDPVTKPARPAAGVPRPSAEMPTTRPTPSGLNAAAAGRLKST
jgi:hypothetical protein